MTSHAHARAFWVLAPGAGEIRPAILAEPDENHVMVRTLFSGVSRGTEALVFAGRVPASEHRRMRAPFQEGEFPSPVKYGYQSVGVVERGGRELEGRVVFCLFPHQTQYVVPSDAVHVLPADVPPARAVLAANMETALNGVWDACPLAGDRVVVVGGGAVGCLTAWLVGRFPGCTVQLVDVNPERAQVAAALGVSFAEPGNALTDADVVIHASGSASGLTTALNSAGADTTIVELSWFGDTLVQMPLGGAFHAKRLTIKSSQVGNLPPGRRGLWTYRRRMTTALRLLNHPALDVLITGESAFDELPQLLPQLTNTPSSTICQRIRY